MTALIIIIVVLLIAVSIGCAIIKRMTEKATEMNEDLGYYQREITAMKADNSRLMATLEDIQIIEERRRADEKTITTIDDDDIAGILNELFDSSGPDGDG